MEAHDRELIHQLSAENVELHRLYQQHEKFERKLSRFENRAFLSTREEMEAKRLKILKLKGVDQMMRIISVHKSA